MKQTIETCAKERARNWCLLLYPEDPTHATALERLETLKYRYVAMKHDQDVWSEHECQDGKHEPGTVKKTHVHVVIKCKQARWNTSIAKDLGIAPNYMQQCADFDEAVLYLTHVAHPDKAQYDSSLAFGSLTAHLEKLLLDDDEGTRVLLIVDAIDALPGEARYRDILVHCCKNGLYGEFRRLGCGVKYLLDEHNADIFQERARAVQLETNRARAESERREAWERFTIHETNLPFRTMIDQDQEELKKCGYKPLPSL